MSENTFHIEFAESLGLCLFCHCQGRRPEDDLTVVGVWDGELQEFLDEEGDVSDYTCDVCKVRFEPKSTRDRLIEIHYDCTHTEPLWVGFQDDRVHLHLDESGQTPTHLVAGLLEWSTCP